jgi:hypothetical protein
MTLFGYLLPPGSGQKLNLRELKSRYEHSFFTHNKFTEIVIFLSIIMFSILLSNIMPQYPNSIPTIMLYFIRMMVMSTISDGASVLVISLHCRNANNRPMRLWVSEIVSCREEKLLINLDCLNCRSASIYVSILLGYCV